jgi:hypothetical protein
VSYEADGSTFTSDIRFDDNPGRHPGDHIEIRYDRRDPASATATDGDSISPALLVVASIVFISGPILLIIGIVLLVRARRLRHRAASAAPPPPPPPAAAQGWGGWSSQAFP